MGIYVQEPGREAEAAIIWLHGLGADASDMQGLAQELRLSEQAVRQVYIDAPVRPVTLNGGMAMPAWYDIMGMQFTDREDRAGMEDSRARINQVIEAQLADGMSSDQIYLAGFSQGGAMALLTGLQFPQPLGGIVALSAYLPLARELSPRQSRQLPIFVGSGELDPLVLPQWTRLSLDWLKAAGYQTITEKLYPIEHSVCLEELQDLRAWFLDQLGGESA